MSAVLDTSNNPAAAARRASEELGSAVLSAQRAALEHDGRFSPEERRALLALRSRRVRRRRIGPIRPSARRALAEFRRELDALPETAHPIGL